MKLKHVRSFALAALLAATTAGAVGSLTACKTTTSAGTQVDDAGIKVAVKAKLASDVRLSTLTNIDVNSTNGVVTLSGQVENEADRASAAALARSVDGVVKVNNELQVKR